MSFQLFNENTKLNPSDLPPLVREEGVVLTSPFYVLVKSTSMSGWGTSVSIQPSWPLHVLTPSTPFPTINGAV